MWVYKSWMYKVHKTFRSGTTFHIKLYEYISDPSPLWEMHKLADDVGSHVTAIIREKRRALLCLGEINRNETFFVLSSVITYITCFYRSVLVIRQHMITLFTDISALLKVIVILKLRPWETRLSYQRSC